MYRALASATVFILFAAFSCAAQSTDSGSQPQSKTPVPAAPQASATGDKAGPAVPPDQPKKKPKKVWTNEEIASVGGDISVVGNSSGPRQKALTDSSDNGSKAALIMNYRKQILQLQAQMDKIDKQIADFRNFKPNDSSSGGMDPHLRYTTTSPEERVKQLEEKRKQLQAKIDAVEEAARKDGIEPGQLR